MITRVGKTPRNTLAQAAELVLNDKAFRNDHFPMCTSTEELLRELAKSHEPWSILSLARPAAVFRLRVAESQAILDKFLALPDASLLEIARQLKEDAGKLQAKSIQIQVPEEMTQAFESNGFQKTSLRTRMSGPVIETQLMPILRINNPTRNDIPELAKLMYESYEKNLDGKLQDLASAENVIRGLISGELGPFVEEASVMSGTHGNVVSACLVTLNSPREANVVELFTHPLYRARGLATIELATCMNKLRKLNVHTLTVWIRGTNDVARRLFEKHGFKQDRSLVEMRAVLP